MFDLKSIDMKILYFPYQLLKLVNLSTTTNFALLHHISLCGKRSQFQQFHILKILKSRDSITMSDSTKYNGKVNGIEGKTPFLIGVAGGTASGKSTVCKRIMERLGQVDVDHTQRKVVSISQDSFYRELTAPEISKAEKGLFNFDHPDAFDEKLMEKTLKNILAGKKVEIYVYDFKNHTTRKDEKLTIYPADVVLFEGILVFYFPEIRNLFHMKLFVDTDSDTRLARRVPRDINERGRDLEQVLNQYMNFVKPAFEEFCSPTKKFADVIIPRGADNHVAIDLIVQHIREFLSNRQRINEGIISPTGSRPICIGMNIGGGGDPQFKRPH